ncbi:hypothetical protein [Deinococcus hohokamensis]|uniref:Uncharacterized protein n=1 Tax=Deinococcus hohokamensis TaxID=309883 RepID=A0ABV9I7F3_9DEIO
MQALEALQVAHATPASISACLSVSSGHLQALFELGARFAPGFEHPF